MAVVVCATLIICFVLLLEGWAVPRSKLDFKSVIGKGEFGGGCGTRCTYVTCKFSRL